MNSQFEILCRQLKDKHPRSGHTDDFIEKARQIVSNEKSFLHRSEFYVQTGPQWGIDFIEDLISFNLVKIIKKRNKQFVANMTCNYLSLITENEIIKF